MFWQQVEACTAVLMVSFTAFRSIFVADKNKAVKNSSQSSLLRRIRSWILRRNTSSDDGRHRLASHNPDPVPPQVTLGSRFWSARGSALEPTHPQSQAVCTDLQSEESISAEGKDMEASRIGETEISAEKSLEDSPQTPKDSLRSEKRASARHWWQMGIISNFTLTRSRSYDS